MLPGRKASYLFILSILLIISFDAFQQKFYLDTFNLYPSETITFWDILGNHLSRWLIWLIVSISYVAFAWKKFTENEYSISLSTWGTIAIFVFSANFVSIILICLLNMQGTGSEWSMASFSEFFMFMFYQKGLSFTFAASLLVLLIYNRASSLIIDAQWVEIKNLKDQSLPSSDMQKPTLTIKIGNKLKLIPLSEVYWFEADDYCVKVHTSGKAYTMRKSLKSLQKELAPLNFIRIHRSALLNLDYLDHVDFHSSIVRLRDTSEIPVSRSGASLLKNALHTKTV